MEPMDSEEYRLCWEDSNSSAEPEPEPRPVPHRSVRDCFVRLENIVLPGLRAPRPERSPSPEAPRRDGGRGRSRARSRSVAPSRPGSRAASRPRHKSRDPRSASCPRKPSSGMPRIMLGRSKSASAQALLKCALCLKSFHLLASLNKHVQAHQLSTPDRCLLCGAHVEGLGQAVEHFLSHPAEPLGPGREATVECRVCGRVFPRKRLYRLATHVLTHTGEQPFHCATCHGQFRTTSAVLLHAQRVHGARDAGFTKKAALVRSIAPQFRCALCAVRVTSARQLDKHQQEVHGGCKGPGVHSATCLYCPVVLDSPGDMERHLREAHAQDRPYACQRCPKRFPTKWGVDRHYRRTHSHKFSCSMCPARFSNSKACLDHVNQVHQKPTSV